MLARLHVQGVDDPLLLTLSDDQLVESFQVGTLNQVQEGAALGEVVWIGRPVVGAALRQPASRWSRARPVRVQAGSAQSGQHGALGKKHNGLGTSSRLS